MPFILMRNDLTKVQADAIVNPSNERLLEGSGTSKAVFEAAGEVQLTEACARIGHCEVGKAVITDAYGLNAKYIIHAVCPLWEGGVANEEKFLYSAYAESLKLAEENHCESIAFPLLSSGSYQYPKAHAMKTAISAIHDFLMEHDMQVYMVLYDRDSVIVSKKLFSSIEEYIDDHYVEEKDEDFEDKREKGDFFSKYPRSSRGRKSAGHSIRSERMEEESCANNYFLEPDVTDKGLFLKAAMEDTAEVTTEDIAEASIEDGAPLAKTATGAQGTPSAPSDKTPLTESSKMQSVGRAPSARKQKNDFSMPKRTIETLVGNLDETFSEMLLRLIDERGLKDSTVYKKANVDRRHFSKIRNDIYYSPTKKTVAAFAIALELTMDEAIDLMKKAGYAFSNSSKFDVIISFFIENSQYDVFEINEVLFTYDQPTLGE